MPNRRRTSRLSAALIAYALATACKAGVGDATQASATANAAPRETTVVVLGSAAASIPQAPDTPREGCTAIAKVFRDAAKTEGARASVFAGPQDTTTVFPAWPPDAPEVACVVTWGDSTYNGAPLEYVYSLLERSGWRRRMNLLQADGPGAEATALSRTGLVCIVGGGWDADDDSDSTYVPKPGFKIDAMCFHDRPDPP